MRAQRLNRELMAIQHGASIPVKGDARLYILEGVHASQIRDDTHEQTLERWREWTEAKAKGDELRNRIANLRSAIPHRNGDLCKPWGGALESVALRHGNLRRASRSGLPLTLNQFERKSGIRGKFDNATHYRNLLTGTENPVQTVAEVCQVEREEIEDLRSESVPFVEYTFLHRVYLKFIHAEDAVGRTQLALDCASSFVEWTHGEWNKTTITTNGIRYGISMLSMGIRELTMFVEFIDEHSKHASQRQQQVVDRLFDALECMWGMLVPDHIDEWLDVRHRSLASWARA